LNDILIYLTNKKDHIKQINLILKALRKTGMRINGLKYTFHAKEMEFLGYIVGSNKIKIDLKKVQAV
jgi:hypothetical protein